MSTHECKIAIVAPFYLLPELSAELESAPETREARKRGTLALSGNIDSDASETIIVVPDPECTLEWAKRRNRRPLTLASAMLAQCANFAERPCVSVVREKDFPLYLNELVRMLADKPPVPRIGYWANKWQPPVPASGIDAEPLRIYENLPVRPGASSWWPYDLFDTPQGPCTCPIDIMGRPRILCFGPYIVLAQGDWQAEVRFSLSGDAVPYDYLIEFGTLGNFSRVLFRPECEGQHTVRLRYSTQADVPTEIRIALLRAAFHGQLSFIGAQITRLPRHGD